MKNQEFFGLYCGYSQEDILEIKKEIQNEGYSYLMDNYILRQQNNRRIIMEDKWEAESPKILYGNLEKIILDAITLEYLNKRSRFESLDDLTDYMVREEEVDMEEYLRNEEEWEY